MSETHSTVTQPAISVSPQPECADSSECHHEESNGTPSDLRIDGAGEPCPTPLKWQEIHETYLSESQSWEFDRGATRVFGRSWGEGEPLYFLNNFAATAELFSLTAYLLKDEFRCVVFDSVITERRISSKSTMGDFRDDLVAVADFHRDEMFSIYGAGIGAAVGIQTAIDHPLRVKRLILQHGFARRRLSVFERLLALICLRSSKTLNDLPQRQRFQAVNHRPWFPPFDESRFEFLINSTGRLPLRELARRAVAVDRFDLSDRVGEVGCPVMILRTEGEGRMAADAQVSLERQFKTGRIEWMHSAGQHPYLTHPHRVAKLIRSFCEG